MNPGLSARAAARELGLTHSALLKAAKEGRITKEEDGGFDVETVRRQLAENSNAMKRRKPMQASVTVPVTDEGAEQVNQTLAEAVRRKEWARVQKEELALKRIKGELAPIGEINAWVAGQIIRAREVLTRIGPELKDRLAQETNPHECEKLITGEVERALRMMAEFQPAAETRRLAS